MVPVVATRWPPVRLSGVSTSINAQSKGQTGRWTPDRPRIDLHLEGELVAQPERLETDSEHRLARIVGAGDQLRRSRSRSVRVNVVHRGPRRRRADAHRSRRPVRCSAGSACRRPPPPHRPDGARRPPACRSPRSRSARPIPARRPDRPSDFNATAVATSLESAISCRLRSRFSSWLWPPRIWSSGTTLTVGSSQPISACNAVAFLTDTVVKSISPSDWYDGAPSTEIKPSVLRVEPGDRR